MIFCLWGIMGITIRESFPTWHFSSRCSSDVHLMRHRNTHTRTQAHTFLALPHAAGRLRLCSFSLYCHSNLANVLRSHGERKKRTDERATLTPTYTRPKTTRRCDETRVRKGTVYSKRALRHNISRPRERVTKEKRDQSDIDLREHTAGENCR